MTGIRWIATLAIAVMAVWLIDETAISLYALNLKKREIADRTNDAYASQMTAREEAGRLARRNADDLEPFSRRHPMDADLQVIRAANLRLIGRNFDAAEAYATAVRYKPTPELLISLGETQLALGRIDEARVNFDRAVAFNPRMARSVERILNAAPQK